MCVCVCVEMLDCGESYKMRKISGKVDKSDTYKGFFVRNPLNKEWNITTKPFVFDLSIFPTYFYHVCVCLFE